MQSFFKTQPLVVDGHSLTIRELSAGTVMAIAGKPQNEVALILCKECVVEWGGETIETITANVPTRIIRQIAAAVFDLSGIGDEKNSEPTPSAGSSTG